jgi:hypothetical protein
MLKLLCSTFVLSLLFAVPAFAHGAGSEHIMGVVKSIDATTLTVTRDAKDVAVHLDASTKFEKNDKPAAASDVKPGQKVVVHAMKHGEMLHAEMVKIADAAKP